jgi:hypothetical protein
MGRAKAMNRLSVCLILALLACPQTTVANSNIDPNHKSAWSENVGWTDWRDASGAADGVIVGEGFLSGYVWAENTGWIRLGNGPADGVAYANVDGADAGVNIDAQTGELYGYGWAENAGWINFDTSALGNDLARFDPVAGRFYGYAWGENAGWINLDDAVRFVAKINSQAIPTVSEWGLVIMFLLSTTAGTVMWRQWAHTAALAPRERSRR